MDLKVVTEKVNRLSEELEKLRPLKPEDEQRVMQKFRLDWNYNSNIIEGNTLTFGETKALLLFGITAQGKPLKDHLEIEGHNEAIDYIIKVAQINEPLTEAFIRELHKIILHEPYEIDAITTDGQPTKKRVEIGKYKTTPNHVKTITGEIFYFSSPEDTPAKMEELMKWYKDNLTNKKIHPLMFAVEFHHRFIRIHPFDDGNGRIVRLLMNLLLMQKGLPPVIVKVKDKEEYYRTLHIADSGDLEPFYIYIGMQLIHSLEVIINAAKSENIEELDDIDKEIALFRKEIEKNEEIKEIKSDDTIEKLINNVIYPLGKEIINKMNGVADLFLYNDLSLFFRDVNNKRNKIKITNMDVDTIKQNIHKTLSNFSYINEFQYIYEFNIFKKNIQNPFDLILKISIVLNDFHYNLLVNGFDTLKYKLYDSILTNEEFIIIMQKAKKNCLEQIRKNLDNK